MGMNKLDLKVSDIMSRAVLTALPDETVITAAKKMAALNVGAIVVVDASSEVLGIFTERDMMNKVVAKDKNVKITPLSQVMTAAPMVARPENGIVMVGHIFKGGSFRHLPVVDEHNKLVGIISAKDATKAVFDIIGVLAIQ